MAPGCSEGIRIEPCEDSYIDVNFEQVAQTRTGYDGSGGIQWTSGDAVKFAQYACVSGTWGISPGKMTLSADAATVSASFSFRTPDDGTTAYYYSLFPYAANISTSTVTRDAKKVLLPQMEIPAAQSPTADSFDPDADILISECVENVVKGESSYTLQLRYTRPVALAKMNITFVPTDSEVTEIVFSASGKAIAGKRTYDLSTGDVYDGARKSDTDLDTITLTYADGGRSSASESMIAYFCCLPFELAEGDTFSVRVSTADGRTYSRDITLSGAQTLKLERGRGTRFTVNMDTGELSFDSYTFEDFTF